ncbi:MAG: hypothetical protein KAI45_07020, partial [Melioribacteraceae bacterium]|nr:hypothetical protein [Melioribacteraceae bacterium]
MNRLKVLIIISLFSSLIIVGQEIGVWKNYTDMKFVTDIKISSDGFWMSSSGGAGNYLNELLDYKKFLTKSEGLNSQNLTTLNIDKEGKVWFGMLNGVIDIYNPDDGTIKEILDIFQSNYTKKNINDFYISGDTNFVSTEFGLSLINTKVFAFIETVIKFGDFTSAQRVNSVNVLNNKIYVSTENGVAIQKDGATNLIAPESWLSYETGSTIPAGETYATVYFDNRIIAATNVGLVQFDGAIWSHYAYDARVYDVDVRDDKLFVLFSNSLHTYDGSTDNILYTSDTNEFHKFDLSADKLLIATNLGVIEVESDTSQTIIPNGPINNAFQNLAVDKTGALWVGTGNDKGGVGFMKFDGSEWTNYNTTTFPELPNNNYHNVSADDYQVYLSNWGSGLTIEDNNSFSYLNAYNSELVGIPSSPNYVVIMNAERDSNQDLWFFNHASADGKPIIQLTTDSVWYHYSFPFFQLSEKVHMTDGIIDEYNTKWFTVISRGLFYFNENGTPGDDSNDIWGWLKETDGLNSNDFTALAVDQRGELWIGTPNGANVLANPSSPQSRITSVYTLREQSITSIAVDPLNNKWVGTYQGVFVITPDGTHLIDQYDSKNSPLPTNEILSIAIDKNSGLVNIGTS